MENLNKLITDHLFEQAPITIAVLDKNLEIIRANERFRDLFGDWKGKKCYELLKGRSERCEICRASHCFEDGKVRVADDLLSRKDGSSSKYVVRLSPLGSDNGTAPEYLIYMASDVREATSLRLENEILFERVPCYVTVLDSDMNIVRANKRMRRTFGAVAGKKCYEVYKRRDRPCRECPSAKVFRDGRDHTSTQVGMSASGEETRYVVTASPLTREGDASNTPVTHVIEMATDITHLRQLEKEKLVAERLAAVGQTVAGLAHGIKNMLMGLEGGIYVMKSGIKKEDNSRIERGMEMLDRNVDKISSMARNLLDFSKGRVPKVEIADPNKIAGEIYELYKDSSSEAGINLKIKLGEGIGPAPLDPEGIHTCLANLVSNAIDACEASDRESCTVSMETYEKNGTIFFTVSDNGCGMDYDVKKKIFTTFFTTKGGGGTGLGLLITRKIIQENGGRIVVDSRKGEGTTFRIELPRERLPEPSSEPEED